MNLVMTLLVRDEADIIAANLDYHLSQGVDHVIVTDNGSRDGTVGIVEQYVRRGVATLLHEPADDYAQGVWVTRMARLAAARFAADWVINNDADEFWWPREGSLRSALADVPAEAGVVVAQRANFIPRPGRGAFWERMVVRETASRNAVGQPLPPKVCHRGARSVVVAQGNHSVEGLPAGAAVLDDGRIEILHFPLRSYAQFEHKIVVGGRAYRRNTSLHPSTGGTWRALYELYERGGLPAHYAAQQLSDAAIEVGLSDGTLVMDTRLRDALRARTGSWCPTTPPVPEPRPAPC